MRTSWTLSAGHHRVPMPSAESGPSLRQTGAACRPSRGSRSGRPASERALGRWRRRMGARWRQRFVLGLAVWGLRLAALCILALWFVPERRYEQSAMAERTYFGLGWPEHWLASEGSLEFRPTLRYDGTWSYRVRKRGPLTAWDPLPPSTGLDDAFTYRRWKRGNPLYGPLWQTGVAVACWVTAAYFNQFRRPPPVPQGGG